MEAVGQRQGLPSALAVCLLAEREDASLTPQQVKALADKIAERLQ
jgi:hypothetical protein